MCAPDPNAGIRMQAKINYAKEKQIYAAKSLKFWNSELSYKHGMSRVNKGYSRTTGDIGSQAYTQLKKSRLQQQEIQRELLEYETDGQGKVGPGETAVSRSRRFGRAKYMTALSKIGAMESQIYQLYGQSSAEARQRALIQRQAQEAEIRSNVQKRPIWQDMYMPPRDTVGQAVNTGLMALQIGATVGGFA